MWKIDCDVLGHYDYDKYATSLSLLNLII
jgi:hypothetical protein